VPYENPQGRRINVLAAYAPFGPAPALTWGLERGSLVSEQLLGFLPLLPRQPDQPLVVVLDNGSMHVSKLVQAARAALREQRIYLYFLPPYSPELNLIEAVFGGIKAHGLPARAYTDWEALDAAIDAGFTDAEQRLLTRTTNQLGQAA
jgi:transposase